VTNLQRSLLSNGRHSGGLHSDPLQGDGLRGDSLHSDGRWRYGLSIRATLAGQKSILSSSAGGGGGALPPARFGTSMRKLRLLGRRRAGRIQVWCTVGGARVASWRGSGQEGGGFQTSARRRVQYLLWPTWALTYQSACLHCPRVWHTRIQPTHPPSNFAAARAPQFQPERR